MATFSLQILSDTSFALQCIGFSGGQLPSRHTVLSRVDETTNIQIPIDAKHVTKSITHKGVLEQGANGDLWSILVQLIDGRSDNTDVIKVKSHMEHVGPSVIKQNKIACHHMFANSLADVVAEEAADIWVEPGEASDIYELDTLLKKRRKHAHGLLSGSG